MLGHTVGHKLGEYLWAAGSADVSGRIFELGRSGQDGQTCPGPFNFTNRLDGEGSVCPSCPQICSPYC